MAQSTSTIRRVSVVSLFGVTAFVALLWCATHHWPLRTSIVCVVLGLFSSLDFQSTNPEVSIRDRRLSKLILGLRDLIAGAAAGCLLVGLVAAAAYLTNSLATTVSKFVLQLSTCLGAMITWSFPWTAVAVRKFFAIASSFNFPAP